jgi:hypothetical protein
MISHVTLTFMLYYVVKAYRIDVSGHYELMILGLH